MVEVILVRSNSVIYDPRVHKIVRSLNKKYSVPVLGWNRDGISKEKLQDYDVGVAAAPYKNIVLEAIITANVFEAMGVFPSILDLDFCATDILQTKDCTCL